MIKSVHTRKANRNFKDHDQNNITIRKANKGLEISKTMIKSVHTRKACELKFKDHDQKCTLQGRQIEINFKDHDQKLVYSYSYKEGIISKTMIESVYREGKLNFKEEVDHRF